MTLLAGRTVENPGVILICWGAAATLLGAFLASRWFTRLRSALSEGTPDLPTRRRTATPGAVRLIGLLTLTVGLTALTAGLITAFRH
ncbi:hypothetical protein ACFV1L_03325 [Kitasatospora sp. NPDC059646]|uniref:hypothetical protein n=1 Tax=Kitasatospora sp. NPDC059646 TaxID=3346893 RepID=UPI00369AE0BD